MERETVAKHLVKNSELKNLPNELLTKGFLPNTIAEKLGWLSRLGWTQREIADHPDVTVGYTQISRLLQKIDTDKMQQLFYESHKEVDKIAGTFDIDEQTIDFSRVH